VKVVGEDYTWLSYKKTEKSEFDNRRKNLNKFEFVRLFTTPGPKMAEYVILVSNIPSFFWPIEIQSVGRNIYCGIIASRFHLPSSCSSCASQARRSLYDDYIRDMKDWGSARVLGT